MGGGKPPSNCIHAETMLRWVLRLTNTFVQWLTPRNTHDNTLKCLALAVIDVKLTEERNHAEHSWLRVQPHDLRRSRHVFVKLSEGTQLNIYSRTI